METVKKKIIRRKRRHTKIRKKVVGTNQKPRLTVFRSSKNIYCQVIDDFEGKTLVCASSNTKDIKDKFSYGGNLQVAEAVGAKIANKAKKIGINDVVFDRAGYKFHGRIKMLAEAARKEGLNF